MTKLVPCVLATYANNSSDKFFKEINVNRARTVFILGAGASAGFDYPTGEGLTEEIIGALGSQKLQQDLDLLNFLPHEINKFREDFRKSSRRSIDAFLEHRKEYLPLGKYLIAKILASKEKDEILRVRKGNWYQFLFNALIFEPDSIKSNNLHFITFNYDRSLEQYFYGSLIHTFGKKPDEAKEMMSNLDINHLFGQIGFLPWQANIQVRPYEKDDFKRVKESSEMIFTFAEKEMSDETFKKAKATISMAKRVYFLGFGYDPQNISRFDFANTLPGKEVVMGTSKGMYTEEVRRTIELIGNGLRLPNPHMNCFEFLKEFVTI